MGSLRRVTTLAALLVLGTPAIVAADPAPLDLGALLAEADRANPGILAASARLEAAEHVPAQREVLPDPQASIAYTNDSLDSLTLGSSPDAGLELSFTQDVPYAGKRRLAGDVARAEIEIGERSLVLARLRLRAEVKAVYAELVRLERTVAILAQSREILGTYRDAARARYESGEGILQHVLKAQTDLSRLAAQIETLEIERRNTGWALGLLLGRPTDSLAGTALVPPHVTIPEPAAAEQAARENSPVLAARLATARREERRLTLAERELKPDFTWGATYVHRGGIDPLVGGSLALRLPLYRKRKQVEAVAQARFELAAAEQDTEASAVQVVSEVRELLAHAEHSGTLVRLYEEGILPQARTTLDAAAAAYVAGRVDFITLLDDFGDLVSYEMDLEQQRMDRVAALADLEPLTGLELVTPAGGADD